MMPDGGDAASAAAPVPLARAPAWPTAADWAAIPVALVVWGGSSNGASRVAAADALA
ncbi:hypothetical protein [Mycobacterium colombiense]|uniref:hypothetical protein n=1 Tax=Mycobacterium colombiense TaxID=339268 RepID=UPI000B20A5E4|nr:hypothetical protein [Mycobacterium colombiense]